MLLNVQNYCFVIAVLLLVNVLTYFLIIIFCLSFFDNYLYLFLLAVLAAGLIFCAKGCKCVCVCVKKKRGTLPPPLHFSFHIFVMNY
jgi:hypothetical protein